MKILLNILSLMFGIFHLLMLYCFKILFIAIRQIRVLLFWNVSFCLIICSFIQNIVNIIDLAIQPPLKIENWSTAGMLP